MSAERDVNRIVRSWIRTEGHESADRVLQTVLSRLDATPQRRSMWPAWRTFRMNKLALTAAAAATVLVVAVVGYNLLPGLGIGGPGATPSPSPSLLARGDFIEHDWGRVEFEATRVGSSVTGRMTVGEGRPSDEGWPITVEFHCARANEDGLIMIGGSTTEGNQLEPEGTLAWIALRRGSPDRGRVGIGFLSNVPGTQTTDCLAYLDAWSQYNDEWSAGSEWISKVLDGRGSVEFGP